MDVKITSNFRIPKPYALALARSYTDVWNFSDYSSNPDNVVSVFKKLFPDNQQIIGQLEKILKSSTLEMNYKNVSVRVLKAFERASNVTNVIITPLEHTEVLRVGNEVGSEWIYVIKPCRIELIKKSPGRKVYSSTKHFGTIVYVILRDVDTIRLKDIILLPLLPFGKKVDVKSAVKHVGLKSYSYYLDIIPALKIASLWDEGNKALVDLYGDIATYPFELPFPFVSAKFGIGSIKLTRDKLSPDKIVLGYKVVHNNETKIVEGFLSINGVSIRTGFGRPGTVSVTLENGSVLKFARIHSTTEQSPFTEPLKVIVGNEKLIKFFSGTEQTKKRVIKNIYDCDNYVKLLSVNSDGVIGLKLATPLHKLTPEDILMSVKPCVVELNKVNLFLAERTRILIIPARVSRSDEGFTLRYYVVVGRLNPDGYGGYWEVKYKVKSRRVKK